MVYLIDTHIFIWYARGDKRLSPNFTQTINSSDNRIIISTASLWEIATKVWVGKLELDVSFKERNDYLKGLNIEQLGFDSSDLQQLIQLPFHHRDPFDRLIISRAINNNSTLMSDDPKFKLYPVQLLDT